MDTERRRCLLATERNSSRLYPRLSVQFETRSSPGTLRTACARLESFRLVLVFCTGSHSHYLLRMWKRAISLFLL